MCVQPCPDEHRYDRIGREAVQPGAHRAARVCLACTHLPVCSCPVLGTASPHQARRSLILGCCVLVDLYTYMATRRCYIMELVVAFGMCTLWSQVVWKLHTCVLRHIPVPLRDPRDEAGTQSPCPGWPAPPAVPPAALAAGSRTGCHRLIIVGFLLFLISANSCCAQCTRGCSWHSW